MAVLAEDLSFLGRYTTFPVWIIVFHFRVKQSKKTSLTLWPRRYNFPENVSPYILQQFGPHSNIKRYFVRHCFEFIWASII